jgi:hypothetical protein
MAVTKRLKKLVRRSISLPPEVDNKIQVIARRERRSANQVLENLIAAGLETRESEKKRFFELTERLTTSTSTSEQRRIKEELARMTFGV